MLYCTKRFIRAGNFQFRINVKCEILFLGILESPYYRTRVRSLAMLVTHWLLLTHYLTDCRLVNLIDVTLACEDANSKLVGAVTVANVDAGKLFFWRAQKLLATVWCRFGG